MDGAKAVTAPATNDIPAGTHHQPKPHNPQYQDKQGDIP